ncbi:right-handed parallel beta-helix repeat-containing protein [Cellulophaga sp. Asnod2-G02]|uniref:right-handed parallel beta-helix repeat-containing protein n=1 Tax=Cellulophaga sp. Asnod2-G02 TaxID=3160572 RepID=UPI0038644F51
MKQVIFITFLIAFSILFLGSSCQKDQDLLAEVIQAEEPIDENVLDDATPAKPPVETDNGTSEDLDAIISNQFLNNPRVHGALFCGPYTDSEPLILNGLKDVTISGLKIINIKGNAIKISNCENLIIEKCFISNATGNGIAISGSSKNITVRNIRMDSVSTGVYAQDSQGIVVENIEVKNVLGPFPRGQLVQFNQVSGKGNKINYNILENIVGKSYGEDSINLFNSHGTIDSPIEVFGNWIRGKSPSLSGGGIMTGDSGGSYIWVKDNVIVDPGGYGIGIAGGTNITIENNYVCAKNKDGKWSPIFVANWSGSSCSDNTIKNNIVSWITVADTYQVMKNAGGCGIVIGWDTNDIEGNFDAAILPEKILIDCDN